MPTVEPPQRQSKRERKQFSPKLNSSMTFPISFRANRKNASYMHEALTPAEAASPSRKHTNIGQHVENEMRKILEPRFESPARNLLSWSRFAFFSFRKKKQNVKSTEPTQAHRGRCAWQHHAKIGDTWEIHLPVKDLEDPCWMMLSLMLFSLLPSCFSFSDDSLIHKLSTHQIFTEPWFLLSTAQLCLKLCKHARRTFVIYIRALFKGPSSVSCLCFMLLKRSSSWPIIVPLFSFNDFSFPSSPFAGFAFSTDDVKLWLESCRKRNEKKEVE